jgi:hypothetical protein
MVTTLMNASFPKPTSVPAVSAVPAIPAIPAHSADYKQCMKDYGDKDTCKYLLPYTV